MNTLIRSEDPHKSIAPRVADRTIAANSPIGLPLCSVYRQLISKDTKVDKEIIALNAIAKLSELKDPRNALSTGLLHCNAKLTRELPIDK